MNDKAKVAVGIGIGVAALGVAALASKAKGENGDGGWTPNPCQAAPTNPNDPHGNLCVDVDLNGYPAGGVDVRVTDWFGTVYGQGKTDSRGRVTFYLAWNNHNRPDLCPTGSGPDVYWIHAYMDGDENCPLGQNYYGKTGQILCHPSTETMVELECGWGE